MRPYMLWLTRVYAGRTPQVAVMGIGWPNVIGDWARRIRWDDWRRGYALRGAPHSIELALTLDPRTNKTIESQRRAADRRAARRRARGAGQGER